MPVPGHREGCETRIFATRCHDCGRKVWYFDCTCGSKVLFDVKGDPWTKHMDSCPVFLVRNLLDQGVSPNRIKAQIRNRAENTGDEFDLDIIKLLNQYGASGKKYIKDFPPSETPTEIAGRLNEIRPINIYKRLKFTKNPIIEIILGEFGQKQYYELIIQEQDTNDPDLIKQWCILIPSDELIGCHPKMGMRVFGIIKGVEIYEDEMVWIAEDLDWK